MDLTLLYNEQPVMTEPYTCVLTDHAEGRCDSLWLEFKDAADELAGIAKGDLIQAVHSSLDSGEMYASEIRWKGKKLAVKALSMPAEMRVASSMSWDSVSFSELISSIAAETKLKVVLLDTLNAQYETVTRFNMPPIQFLQARLSMEGFACKVKDKKLIVYDERKREHREYTQQLQESDFNHAPEYSTSDATLAAMAINSYETPGRAMIQTKVSSGIPGQVISENIAVSTIGESERYCKGLLRQANKYEYIASGELKGTAYEAGQTVYLIDGPGNHAGLNYIYRVTSDFVNDIQRLEMRRPILGDS